MVTICTPSGIAAGALAGAAAGASEAAGAGAAAGAAAAPPPIRADISSPYSPIIAKRVSTGAVSPSFSPIYNKVPA